MTLLVSGFHIHILMINYSGKFPSLSSSQRSECLTLPLGNLASSSTAVAAAAPTTRAIDRKCAQDVAQDAFQAAEPELSSPVRRLRAARPDSPDPSSASQAAEPVGVPRRSARIKDLRAKVHASREAATESSRIVIKKPKREEEPRLKS
jgi:hypothetical protein